MAEATFPTVGPHLARRLRERQWAEGITEERYLDDLRRAIRAADARLALYMRRGGHIAAVVSDTARIIPALRRGASSRPLLFVVYSADRGIIVTGYQASDLGHIGLPEGVLWQT